MPRWMPPLKRSATISRGRWERLSDNRSPRLDVSTTPLRAVGLKSSVLGWGAVDSKGRRPGVGLRRHGSGPIPISSLKDPFLDEERRGLLEWINMGEGSALSRGSETAS